VKKLGEPTKQLGGAPLTRDGFAQLDQSRQSFGTR